MAKTKKTKKKAKAKMTLPIQAPSVDRSQLNRFGTLSSYSSSMAKTKKTKKKTKVKIASPKPKIEVDKAESTPEILAAVIDGLGEEFGPRMPRFIDKCKEEYRAIRTTHSGNEGSIKVFYVTARIARHYTFRINEDAGVRVDIEDVGKAESGLASDHLGETYFELARPGSLEELSRYLRALEYATARKDQKLHALADENEALKKELTRLKLGLKD